MEFALLVVALMAVAFPSALPVHPGARVLLTGAEIEPVDCRESAPTGSVLEADAPTRTKNFQIMGSFDCRRPIFEAGERNSFIEHLVRSETSKAKRVAAELPSRLAALGSRERRPLGVIVQGINDPEMERLVSSIYRIELASTLGSGQVRRGVDDQNVPRLEIDLRRTLATDETSRVKLILRRDRKEESVW